ERRSDLECSAAELAAAVKVNGKVSAFGYRLTEQAIRGVLGRTASPALSYVLGLRERVQENVARLRHAAAPGAEVDPSLDGAAVERQVAQDKGQIAEVLVHELRAAGDVRLKLRTRKGLDDVFAIVSPKYAPADAPEVIDQVLRGLPSDARGSWAYDP